MADEKKIILSVSADTGEAESSINELKGTLNNINDTTIDKPFKSFKQEIKEATLEAKKMEDQFGRNSKEFTTAAKNVAVLKDRFSEFNQQIAGFNPDNKLQSLVTIAKGATGAIQGLTGGMAFLGVENTKATETIAKLQGLMNFSQALNSVDDIKNGFQQFGGILKDGVIKAFTTLKGAIAATGIGALLVGIGYLISNFDELKQKLGFASKAQDDLNETYKEFEKGAAKAVQSVNEVKTAFDLARKGTISKKEALEKYNDTLGDALGKTQDFAVAEKNMIGKAAAYIEITALKAQANAKFALSAQYAAKALVAGNEDQTSFLDKAKAGALQYFGQSGAAMALAVKAQTDGVAEIQKSAKENSDFINKSAEDDLKKAAELQKKYDVKDAPSKGDKADDSAVKKKLEQAKKDKEELDKLNDEIYKNSLSAYEREVYELQQKYNKEKELLKKNHADTLLLEDNFRKDLSQIISDNTSLDVETAKAATGEKITLDESLRDKIVYNNGIMVEVHHEGQDAQLAWEKITTEEKSELAATALGQVSDLLGKQTVAGKAFAIAQTTIDTYQSATSAFKSLSGIPYVGPILGGIAAAAAIASGISNIKRILAVKVPGKSSGGDAGGISAPVPIAPQINSTMLSSDVAKVQDVRVTNQSDTVVKAYISDKDLQNNQSKTEFLNRLGTF